MPSVTVPFGGGLHTRAFAQDVQEQEATSGQNFQLDPQDRSFKRREPIDLVGTTPNTSEIRGFASLLKSDGSISFLVQSGTTVYDWDGASTFTSKGTVSSSAKLRGRIEHNWQLSDKVIITDINLSQPVMEYDGTTLQNISFLSNPSTAWTGDFVARYCAIIDERAFFANIKDNGTAFPHLIVAAKRSDYNTLSVSDRPAVALAADDPFYLVQPDNRYINGMVEFSGILAISSRKGSIYKLSGGVTQDFTTTALYPDYSMDALHPMSGASGDESFTLVGNDIAYGREGRVESLISTDKFGDTDADDLSVGIFDQIKDYNEWTIVYNSRTQKIYCFPSGQSECWVYHKSMQPTGLSPWVKWTTLSDFAFAPTAVMNMYDPSDGLEYVFAGDASGNIYRLEGTGTDDNGSNIITSHKSRLFKVEGLSKITNVKGYIEYVADQEVEVEIILYYQGQSVLTQSITETLPSATTGAVYGGSYYYGDGTPYGTVTGSIKRQQIQIPGSGNMFQAEVKVTGANTFKITELFLDFQAADAL